MRQLVRSLSGDNNLATFHLWGREIVLKYEKVYKCLVQDCLKIFHLILTFLKMQLSSKSDQFLAEKSKT